MNLLEKKVSSKEVFSFDCYKIQEDTVVLPNNIKKNRTYIQHPGGVGIVAINENKQLAFVQQYRYPIGEVTYEIPAGKLDKNEAEDPLEGAKRELEEETGFYANNIEEIGKIYPSPGIIDEKLLLYFANDLKKGDLNLDEDEFINVFWFSLSQFKEKVKNGEINDSKTITAITMAEIYNLL